MSKQKPWSIDGVLDSPELVIEEIELLYSRIEELEAENQALRKSESAWMRFDESTKGDD
jgi:light-regulated signal transduction histidine kinase (bacteriophytochrome)